LAQEVTGQVIFLLKVQTGQILYFQQSHLLVVVEVAHKTHRQMLAQPAARVVAVVVLVRLLVRLEQQTKVLLEEMD
jgi:3-deoxy-D-arabino-heptulosonate 7-phosphate (DAHP) synthase